MKALLSIFLILLCNKVSFSQNQVYLYDDAGNRIHRTFFIVPTAMVIQNNDTILQYNSLKENELAVDESNEQNDTLTAIEQEELRTQEEGLSEEQATLQYGELKATVFPNPTVNTITITADEALQNGTIFLFNNEGRLIHQQSYSRSNILLMGHLATGYYIVKLVTGETQFVWRVVKMQ